uniref:PTP1-interacting protein, 39 kDa n=1 Tax=Trypanosoma congolense (strain IL3000) TaxID=1068625 RepID=G0UVV3_TRYCI|nr:conserved hypothetical protein [Trypanosoma congolense IL3000]
MPKLLVPCVVELRVMDALPPQRMPLNEEEEFSEGLRDTHRVNREMDFFSDEYISISAGDGASVAVESKGESRVLEQEITAPESAIVANNHAMVDCDVSLLLTHASHISGHSVFHTVRVPSAVNQLFLSTGRLSEVHVPVASPRWIQSPKVMCPEDTSAACKGAAWVGVGPRGKESIKCEGVNDSDDEAAGPCYAQDLVGNRHLLLCKTELGGMSAEYCTHIGEGTCNAAPFTAEAEGDSKAEVASLYTLRLPTDFVLGLRLPPQVQQRLIDVYNRGPVEEAGTRAKIPRWMSAFLHTTSVRYQLSNACQGSLCGETLCNMDTRHHAISVLEGFCTVALNILSRMGRLRLRGAQHQHGNCDESAVCNTQHWLLGTGGIFGHAQVEEVRNWLGSYFPSEVCSEDMGEDVLDVRRGAHSWFPSATAIAFYIAMDLAQELFPSLLTNLEGTILTALQPLLNTQVLQLDLPSPCVPRPLLPKMRRTAIALLTQSPVAWWLWWDEQDRHQPNGPNNGRDAIEHSAATPSRCLSAVSASRGYSAVQVLNIFLFSHVDNLTGGDHRVTEGVEIYEMAQFLLSSPTLFGDLLLDREVTSTLERATIEVDKLAQTSVGTDGCEQADVAVLRVTDVMLRCFFLLLSWMAFRPSGYPHSLAQTYFVQLLRPVSSLYERILKKKLLTGGLDISGEVRPLLAVCAHDYITKLSTVLHTIRGLRHTRHHSQRSVKPLFRNHRWPPRCLVGSSSLNGVDDRSTNASRGCASVNSARSANTEGDVATISSGRSHRCDGESVTDSERFALPPRSRRLLRHAIRQFRATLHTLQTDLFGRDDRFVPPCLAAGFKRFRRSYRGETTDWMSAPSEQTTGRSCVDGMPPRLVYFVDGQPDIPLFSECTEWGVSSDSDYDDHGDSQPFTTTSESCSDSRSCEEVGLA